MPTKKKAKQTAHVGRPPKYNRSYAPRFVKLMKEGLSLTAAAAELNIHRDTAYDWEAKHPEFSDAIKLARGKRCVFWERRLIDNPDTAAIFALKNVAPHEWRDKTEVQFVPPDLSGLNKDDLDNLDAIASRAARLGARSSQA